MAKVFFLSFLVHVHVHRPFVVNDTFREIYRFFDFSRLYWMHQTLKLIIACVFIIVAWAILSGVLVTFGYA